MAGRIAGVCYIKVDGTQLEVKGGVEIPFSNVNRETVMGLAGVAGYKETAQRPYLKLTAVFTRDFPIQQLAEGTNMTITAELANGKVYTLSQAFLEGETVSNGEEGTAEIEFSGAVGTWQ